MQSPAPEADEVEVILADNRLGVLEQEQAVLMEGEETPLILTAISPRAMSTPQGVDYAHEVIAVSMRHELEEELERRWCIEASGVGVPETYGPVAAGL